MSKAIGLGTKELLRILSAADGLNSAVAGLAERESLTLPGVGLPIITQNVAVELAEKAIVKYPVLYVYCEKVTNSLREKFRTFSGAAELVAEIRVSHDHATEMEQHLQLYVEAVTDVLDAQRGEWAKGVVYTGGYEVTFGPVRRGGKSFLQGAKVRLSVNLSTD